jgi:hypothetical protein
MSSIQPVVFNAVAKPLERGANKLFHFADAGMDEVCLSFKKPVQESMESLKSKAEAFRQEAAAFLGINPERVPLIEPRGEDFLPSHALGAFFPALNETHLNYKMVQAFPQLFRLDDIVTHEALVHSYLGNVRTAWAHQFPDEFAQTAAQLVTDQVRRGETGPLLQKVTTNHQRLKVVMSEAFQEKITGKLGLPQAEEELTQGLLANIVQEMEGWVHRDHKFAPAHLTDHTRQAIAALTPQLSSWVARYGGDNAKAAQALSQHVENHMNELFQLRRQVVKEVCSGLQSPVLVEFPHLAATERERLAETLHQIFSSPKEFIRQGASTQPPELTPAALALLEREVLPHIHSLPGNKAKVFRTVKDYSNAQLLRLQLLKQQSIVPNAYRLPSVTLPLTPAEKEHAQKSLQGFLSTVEGNLKVSNGDQSADAVFSYTLGAWEELMARKTASEFSLKRVSDKIAHLEKTVGANDPVLVQARKLQAGLENDMQMVALCQQYVKLNEQLAALPKNPDKLKAIQQLKVELAMAKRQLFHQNRALKDLAIKNEAGAAVSVKGNQKTMEYSISPEDFALYDRADALSSRISQLDAQLSEARQLKNLVSGPEAEAILAQKEQLLRQIRDIAPHSTINPLPPDFFHTLKAHADHHSPIAFAAEAIHTNQHTKRDTSFLEYIESAAASLKEALTGTH